MDPMISLSVRDFVAELEPTGSIDARRALVLDEDPMALGARAHARVQRRLEKEHPGTQSEVTVLATLEAGGFQVRVRGRLDLLLALDPPVVEEIKTTVRPRLLLEALGAEPEHPFILQARLYAWIRWRDTGVAPGCRLRVVDLLEGGEEVLDLGFEPAAFTAWVEGRVLALREAWERAEARRAERRRIGEGLAFPFPEPRPGQAALVEEVASVLAGGGRLLLQAPTGLGKTAAVLFPALARALGEDLRVIYCTPRNSQHEVAEDCLRRMRGQGHAVRSVTLRAKEKVCPQAEVDCRPEACPRAAGHYDRLRESGALEALAQAGVADATLLGETADRHLLCPFELALDAARNADVVVGDYNYVFSPSATLVRFFGTPEEAARNIVLVDEAHNLPSRAADWFSPSLDLPWLEELRRRKGARWDRSLRGRFTRQAKRCQALLEALDGPHRVLDLDAQPFLAEEPRIARLGAEAAARGVELSPAHPLAELQRRWADFCAVLRIRGPEHIITWIPPGRLQVTCAEASAHLAERMAGLASAVLFSATLKPFEYHRRLCGLENAAPREAEVPSPFPPERRKVLVVPQISTLWRRRDREAPRIAAFLSRVLPLRMGNYIVFFPSFDFLERTLPHLDLPGFRVLAQPRRATRDQVAGILAALRGERGLAVLAVQGGSLSEGVDLPGEALIGCVVAGPPLPPFDLEREEVKRHFQARYGRGREYAYAYPAVARAVQAAGRVIRTPRDAGLLVFLDGRFLEPEFACGFPEGWRPEVSASILADVAAFWASCDP
ncbi:MAG TPA: ATP-dependent DNA helicase [Holophaga sp.]|nr:ATP-dependent DNA helicase [Holophaga sp.]